MTSVLWTRVECQKNHKTYAILNYQSEHKWNFTNIFSILNVLTNYVGILSATNVLAYLKEMNYLGHG